MRGDTDTLGQRAQKWLREYIEGHTERSWELGWFTFEEKVQHKESILLQRESEHWNRETLLPGEVVDCPVRYLKSTCLWYWTTCCILSWGVWARQAPEVPFWDKLWWCKLGTIHESLVECQMETITAFSWSMRPVDIWPEGRHILLLPRLIQTNGKRTAVLFCQGCFLAVSTILTHLNGDRN